MYLFPWQRNERIKVINLLGQSRRNSWYRLHSFKAMFSPHLLIKRKASPSLSKSYAGFCFFCSFIHLESSNRHIFLYSNSQKYLSASPWLVSKTHSGSSRGLNYFHEKSLFFVLCRHRHSW